MSDELSTKGGTYEMREYAAAAYLFCLGMTSHAVMFSKARALLRLPAVEDAFLVKRGFADCTWMRYVQKQWTVDPATGPGCLHESWQISILKGVFRYNEIIWLGESVYKSADVCPGGR